MKLKSDAAIEKFCSGYNCAQSVAWAFREDFDADADVILRISCGFGGGIARRQDMCGAVSGGIMVLGLKYGQGEGKDRPYTENTYTKSQEFINRFESAHGTCNCKALLHNTDMTTPEGKEYIAANNLREKVCQQCVRTAVEIVEEMMKE
jgi:C_GCAxxG_C_C family probable redox protein